METGFVLLVPIVIGLVEVVKKAGLASRYAPVTAILFGVIGAFYLIGTDAVSIAYGFVAGLSASGLWAGYKTLTK